MGKSKAPKPPDPRQTAQAQTGTNVGTAIANANLQMVDQYTPYGGLTYRQIGGGDVSDVPGIREITTTQSGSGGNLNVGNLPEGMQNRPDAALLSLAAMGHGARVSPTTSTQYQVGDQTFSTREAAEQYRGNLQSEQGGGYSWTDPYTGATYNIPRFEAITTLSPEEQAKLEANQQAEQALADVAVDRSEFLRDYLPNTEAATDAIDEKLYDLGAARLDPRFADRRDSLRTQLANQGVTPGSEAWGREMRQLGETENDAYNQLLLQGRGQAAAEVNMPINQITALLSGSQVQNPNVAVQTPGAMPTTDVAGLINQNYNQRLNAWQQDMQNRQSLLGGLFGAAGKLGGAMLA